MYGMYPRKGTLMPGADADIAIWDPHRQTDVTAGILHDNVGYTPYEGMTLTGWPVTVISRGRVIVHDGELNAHRGSGKFIARGVPAPLAAPRQLSPQSQFLRSLVRAEDKSQ